MNRQSTIDNRQFPTWAAVLRHRQSSIENRQSQGQSNRRVLLIAIAMIVPAILLGWRMTRPEQRQLSTVQREIVEGVLTGTRLGPFTMRADSYHESRDEFLKVSLESEDHLIGASRASFALDAETDSITLTLFDAVIIRAPEAGESASLSLDRHGRLMLGPLQMEIDITDDGDQ